MRVRRYYGHDCDSVNGFNDGGYIDRDFVEVASVEEAEELCKSFLKQQYGDDIEITEMDSGDAFQVITGHYDANGNDLTKSQYDQLLMDDKDVSYRYVYVGYYFDDERSPSEKTD